MTRNELGELGSMLSALGAANDQRVAQGRLAQTLAAYEELNPRQVSATWTRIGKSRGELQVPGFVKAPPVEIGTPTLFPVVMLGLKRSESGSMSCWVRVALHSDDGVEGWRFELEDEQSTSDKGHFYAHSQRIAGWSKTHHGFDPYVPETVQDGVASSAVNLTRPAFPLACKTPPALLAAAITSLYGSNRTWRILEGYTAKSAALIDELRAITGTDGTP